MKRDAILISVNAVISSLVLLLVMRFCKQADAAAGKTIETRTVIYFDSSKKQISAPAPVVISEKTTTVPVTITDTAAIRAVLKQFFSVRTFSRQYADSSIRADVTNTVTQNMITAQDFNYKWLRPVKTVESSTVTITKEPNGFFIGIFGIGNKEGIGVGPEASFVSKRGVIISGGYDVMNKRFKVGTAIKLK